MDFRDANKQIKRAVKFIADEEEYFRDISKLEPVMAHIFRSPELHAEIVWVERVKLENMRRIADYIVTVGQVIINLCVDSKIKANTKNLSQRPANFPERFG